MSLAQPCEPLERPRSVIALQQSSVESRANFIFKDEIDLGWRDFEHTRTLALGLAKSTLLCYEKKNQIHRCILRACTRQEWTLARSELAEFARISNLFIQTQCIFLHGDRVFVGSERMDMSLADIIDSTISLTEVHVCAVLSKVTEALCCLADREKTLSYGKIQASNVYLKRNGTVKLEGFGHKVCPVRTEVGVESLHHQDIYYLAIHMITRDPEEPGIHIPQQKLVSVKTTQYDLGIQFEATPPFLDFLLLCKEGKDIKRLYNHPFLRNADASCLNNLVDNAEYSTLRHCYPFDENMWNDSEKWVSYSAEIA